jgi:(p)ppGpp synthase/HD superfamily hydrolase
MTASLGDKFMLTARFHEAFQYAHRLHQSRLRKGTAIPYISHLMAVFGNHYSATPRRR